MHSHALLASNQAILTATRYRIAASRRRLNRAFAVSGAGDPDLNEIARALLLRGDLAPIQGTVAWAGRGSGKTCCVCGKSVDGSEVEYEVEEGGRRTPACHLACFVAWQEESRRCATPSPARGMLSRQPSID